MSLRKSRLGPSPLGTIAAPQPYEQASPRPTMPRPLRANRVDARRGGLSLHHWSRMEHSPKVRFVPQSWSRDVSSLHCTARPSQLPPSPGRRRRGTDFRNSNESWEMFSRQLNKRELITAAWVTEFGQSVSSNDRGRNVLRNSQHNLSTTITGNDRE